MDRRKRRKKKKNDRHTTNCQGNQPDGFFFCGFNPKDGEPILAVEAKDAKTIMALNNTLFGVLQSGGVEAMQNQIKKKNEGGPES